MGRSEMCQKGVTDYSNGYFVATLFPTKNEFYLKSHQHEMNRKLNIKLENKTGEIGERDVEFKKVPIWQSLKRISREPEKKKVSKS